MSKNSVTEQNTAEVLNLFDEGNSLTFSLEEVFEGPLDLLLALIAKNKVSIYDIPIQLIFEQYMDYIAKMELFNMEIASSFIVMAAQLMVIKSRMLLPPKEDEEDPRQELVDMLLEYQRAKETANELHERELTYMGRFEKPPQKLESEPEYSLSHEIECLREAFLRAYSRKFASEQNIVLMEEPIGELITATRQISITEKINSVVSVLKVVKRTTLHSVFMSSQTKHELVATLLAILELIKGKRITVLYLNDEDYSECDIQYNEDAEDTELDITTDDFFKVSEFE